MKILLLNHNVKGEGTYIRCFNFAKHLVRFGHSVVILTSSPNLIIKPKKELIDGVEVISFPDLIGRRFRNGGLGPIDTILRCLFVLKRRFDIVENFDHRPVVLYPALVSKYMRKTPLVSEWTDLHGTGGSLSRRRFIVQSLIRPYEDFTEIWSKKFPELLITISSGLKEKALSLGIPDEKIVQISGGADVERITPFNKGEARAIFNLPLKARIVAYTAGTHYDFELLLNSINKIQECRKDVYFVTTGAKLSDELKHKFYDWERVIELGFLPYNKYAKFLPSADVFLFAFSNTQLNLGRWPNKIGDYMAAGRPTVSNFTGDLIHLFDKYQIGLLASENPNDIANKTLRLLEDQSLASDIGKKARYAAEQFFDWKFLAKRLEACFVKVIGEYDKNDGKTTFN